MRRFIAIAALSLLVACQTIPAKPGFSKAQIALLTQEGFKPVEEN
jgi:hypothetical protein